jgi:hypothetical protein
MDDIRHIFKIVDELSRGQHEIVNMHDSVDLELSENFVIETGVVGFMEDGIILQLDEDAMELLDINDILLETNELCEAEYQGHKVTLNKPMQGDVKKSKVYVKKPNGKIVKVNFGDKTMRIKKSNPARRKSFRARHHCENPGPKWKARYWSCKAW